MKKNLLFLSMPVMLALCMASCEKPNATPDAPIPTSFPKKHLIEEFTGQACGYCPYGMDCISEFMGNDSNWVLVLHHYGYQKDNFSVAGCNTITRKLGVNGAPSSTINRAKTTYVDDNGTSSSKIVFHPGYLSTVEKSQFERTTYASVVIDNQYDNTTRELKVHVSGALCNEDYPALKLTVLVKESGMIDAQADYYNSFEGWQEFRHANAVRAYLTEELGDEINVGADRRYTMDLSLTLNDKWVAENCMVVAYLSEDFKPIVQAEEKPVVAGTKGGADLEHGGITPVPVADYYPEPSATATPQDYSGLEADTLNNAAGWYTSYPNKGVNEWMIQAYNTAERVKIGSTTCIPFVYFYILTDQQATTIPTGTYAITTSGEAGTVIAGIRDDAHQQISGSIFYYTSLTYFNQGYLYPSAQFLITDGELVVTDEGWTIVAHARNGAAIKLIGTTPIENEGRYNAPRKMPIKIEQ